MRAVATRFAGKRDWSQLDEPAPRPSMLPCRTTYRRSGPVAASFLLSLVGWLVGTGEVYLIAAVTRSSGRAGSTRCCSKASGRPFAARHSPFRVRSACRRAAICCWRRWPDCRRKWRWRCRSPSARANCCWACRACCICTFAERAGAPRARRRAAVQRAVTDVA